MDDFGVYIGVVLMVIGAMIVIPIFWVVVSFWWDCALYIGGWF